MSALGHNRSSAGPSTGRFHFTAERYNGRMARIVEIEWMDSVGKPEVWEADDADVLVPSQILSVGYLWNETADAVTICQSRSPSQVGRRFTIPRGCIRKMKTIRR